MKTYLHWYTDSWLSRNQKPSLTFGGNMFAFKTFCRCLFYILLCAWVGNVSAEKYRICVVDGKEEYKHSAKYCPRLDQQDSQVECVVASDRLDCLRRIHKGKADFGVFTAEDLVAATNSEIDVLLTNELRFSSDQNFEYELVAIVANAANIRQKHDLRGKKYCHPGYGYEADWTRILSNYFEASVVTPQCHPNLTITENRVKATSNFFGAACKAGPWVNIPGLDYELKDKYPNLCSLCGDTRRCSIQDKYWGRRGSLFCLTDGSGDISWARLDDVNPHFGFTSGNQGINPNDYSLLCPDNTVMPLNSSTPCVWVVKPWSVIAARRAKAQKIQDIISSLINSDSASWQAHLLNLIEPIYYNVEKLDPPTSIEAYLHRAKGFLNANSFSACHPPRTIRICTTSNIETAKCSWLRESAAVYGIEPDLDCLKADNKTHCMMALSDNAADILMVSPDLVQQAKRDFKLSTLFYETVPDANKYTTVAVTKKGSKFKSIKDLQGAKACFPVYGGIAWNSAVHALQKRRLIGCNINAEMANFFGPSCVPGITENESENLWKQCQSDFEGDMGALHCLASGIGDVAFVSSNSIDQFRNAEDIDYPHFSEESVDFKILCEESNENNQPCHLSWAPLGQAMIRSSSSDMWKKDTLNVFIQLDGLFGKKYKDLTNQFSMFGRYDGAADVLFHDETEKLRNIPIMKNTDEMKLPYDKILTDINVCYSSASWSTGTLILTIISLIVTILVSK
ncbi:transferrin [Dendroctonus ponderosae]|uniref:Transferrin n=1 Tax=Dendroctonus ponderosae TaxID=77166 RepID=A0AAR5PYM9_DENPD|nr:transferrin [Dendroctonus ponderosae]